jgi:phage tail protein X
MKLIEVPVSMGDDCLVIKIYGFVGAVTGAVKATAHGFADY